MVQNNVPYSEIDDENICISAKFTNRDNGNDESSVANHRNDNNQNETEHRKTNKWRIQLMTVNCMCAVVLCCLYTYCGVVIVG